MSVRWKNSRLDSRQPLIENLGSGNPRSLSKFATEQWNLFEAKGKLIFGAVPMRKEEVMRYVPKL